jgi:hypothetical protein
MGRDGYMERYGMRKPYDDDEFVRYYWYENCFGCKW